MYHKNVFFFYFRLQTSRFLIDFYNFCTTGNRNECCTKYLQNIKLRHNCVSILPGKTESNTKQPTASCNAFI